jgi:hypothetical protein
MSAQRLLGCVLAAVALSGALPSIAAAADPLRIDNLRVQEGEADWHAEAAFELEWDQEEVSSLYKRTVAYRLYDSDGALVGGPTRQPVPRNDDHPQLVLEVPPAAGVYTLEAWLENADGARGDSAWAKLRFDDSVPAAPAPEDPPTWLAAHARAVLRIGHPQAPLPLSGIRGYAISLDEGSGRSPCAAVERCSLIELDLPGGIGDDAIDLGPLPEGTTFARVVAVSGSGIASPPATAVFHVDTSPPQLSLRGLPGGWATGPVRLTAVAGDRLSGMAAAGSAGPFTAIRVDDSLPVIARGNEASAVVAGAGVHRIAFYARDAAGNVEDGQAGRAPAAIATVAIDEEAPRVLFAPTQDPEEPERIEAVVSDSLSGPSPDRGTIALRAVGSSGRYRELPTRVVGNRLLARWDSDAYRPGRYEFLATGFDRAGNAGTGGNRRSGPKMVLVSPLKSPVRMEAGFGDRYGAARRVPFGSRVLFGGRLSSRAGAPAAGLEVAVTETFVAGSEPSRRTTVVRTGPDGAFSLRLAPGPGRDVSAAFAGTRTLTRASAPAVHLGVFAAVGLRVSSPTARVGGAPVVFSGSVGRVGTAPRHEGLPVELQFRFPGSGWREFRTVRTDRRGRFRYAYRFSDDDSRGVRFRFRAYVPQREGWPYEPAFSHPVVVSGR